MRLNKISGRTTARGNTNWRKIWPLLNTGKPPLSKVVQEYALQKNDRYRTDGQKTALICTITRPMESHRYWTVPQTDTEDSHPILRKEMEAAVQSLKKKKSAGVNNIPAELAQAGGEDLAKPVDPALSHHTSHERQPAAMPELPNDQPHQSPKQSHAEDRTEQFGATSGEDHRWRTGRLQSRKEHHRADLGSMSPLWEISPAPARHLSFLHRLQKGLRQCLAYSFVGNYEEVQHQHQPHPSHQKPL